MNKLVVRIASFILSCLVAIYTFIRFVRVGKHKFLTVKFRENPPPCLLDPNLGRHGHVKLKDIKLHYVMNGNTENPLMVLLHGFPEFWFSWRHQLKEFCKEYCVVAVDLRGYGDSDKPTKVEDYSQDCIVEDIYQLIKHLKGENGKAVVMGHDWGGIISYGLAAKYPEAVTKLVIGNAPHPSAWRKACEGSWRQLFSSWYVAFFQMPFFPEFLLRSEDLAFLGRVFKNRNLKLTSPDELEAYKYIYARPGAFTPPLNYYRAIFRSPNFGGSKRVTVPTLLIWGDRDTALTTLSATASSQYIDEFHLRFVPGASHWIQFERPDEFNRLTWSFLQGS